MRPPAGHTAQETAYGKLNLSLDILGRREDGYHELAMVMQSVALCDTVRCDFYEGGEIAAESDSPYVPADSRNLTWRAAEAFFRAVGAEQPGLSIRIEKRIPVSAGMAGGSSDGAAMLRLLRRELAPALSQEELEAIGASVGSDVPYCIRGTTALARGRGELLTDLPPLPPCTILLCKPDFPISTPELFGAVRVRRLRFHPDTAGLCRALEAGDLEGICRRIYNVFEDVLPRRFSQVLEIKQAMLQLDAMAASMTGSGPTVFGIYGSPEAADRAAEVLRRDFRQVYVTRPVQGNFF